LSIHLEHCETKKETHPRSEIFWSKKNLPYCKICTPRRFNSSPLKIGLNAPIGKDRLPTHHFSIGEVFFSELLIKAQKPKVEEMFDIIDVDGSDDVTEVGCWIGRFLVPNMHGMVPILPPSLQIMDMVPMLPFNSSC